MEAFDDIPDENMSVQGSLRDAAAGEDIDGDDHDMARVLGVKSVVSMSLAAMVGSVLVLPGPAIGLTGASAAIAVGSSAFIVLAAAFDKSEIATAMPVSGGSYVYLAKAFGPMVGTMAGFALWFSLLFKGAFGLAGFNAYLEAMIGKGVVSEWAVKGMGVGLLLIMLAGNIAGVKKIKTIQKIVTLVSLGVILLVCLVSFHWWEPYAFDDHLFENGSTGFIECLAFVFMGYAGLTKICALASEIKHPEVNMPRSIWASLGIFTPFFIIGMTACLGNLPYEELKTNYAPFHTLAVVVGGEGLGWFVGSLGILAMASMANISLMAVARFPYAMARDGLLPPSLSKTNANDAPYISLCASALMMGLAIIFLPVYRIAKLCSAIKLIIFLLVNVSLIVFRIHDEYWYKPTFISPCFPFLQLAGITFKIIMLVYIGLEGIGSAVIICVLGFCLYYAYGQHHAQFIGIIRVENIFGLAPKNPNPIKEHTSRDHKHPICERDFEKEIWEYEEDNDLPHEAHILQVEKLESENLALRQETRRLKVEVEKMARQLAAAGLGSPTEPCMGQGEQGKSTTKGEHGKETPRGTTATAPTSKRPPASTLHELPTAPEDNSGHKATEGDKAGEQEALLGAPAQDVNLTFPKDSQGGKREPRSDDI